MNNKKWKSRLAIWATACILLFSTTACDGSNTNNAVNSPKEEIASSSNTQTTLSFEPGTYKGTGQGKNGPIEVEVEFSKTEILSINVLSQTETEGIGDGPLSSVPKQVIENQTLAIDAVSGATSTANGLIEAIEDCVEQAKGDLTLLKQEKPKQENTAVEELTVDVVVVGAGAAGTAAALAAVDSGAKVVLLEKTASPMGAGTLAGGMFAADSQQQKDSQSTVDKEWLYDQYMSASNGYMNSLLVRKIIDESGPTVDFLESNGAKFNLVDSAVGGAYNHISMPRTLHGYAEGGKVTINTLLETFKAKSGTIRFNTPAQELLYDEAGKVAGVIAKNEDGSTLKVHAKSVVIATGGFGGNIDMLKENFGNKYTVGLVGSNTGDGIRMAWDAGADEYGTQTNHYFAQTLTQEASAAVAAVTAPEGYSLKELSIYPNLRVNLLGQRFSDETNISLFSVHGAEIHMQPKETEYVIIDSKMLDTIKEHGLAAIEEHYSKWKDNPQSYMEFNRPLNTVDKIAAENTPKDYAPYLDSLLGTGAVFKADSIEDLAQEIGVDPAQFAGSVEQYNSAIKEGKDTLFFSDANRMIGVQQAPYYAIKFVARNLGTLGGVRINENIEAVNEDGVAIPGLYVAGADAGGMYGLAYVDFEGGTLGFAYTSGRLAGLNAAVYSK